MAVMATHEVFNQSTPLEGHDAASSDVALMDGVVRYGGEWGAADLAALGRRAGDPEVLRWAELANQHEPELQRYDRSGHRVDTIEFHPAYHHLMTEAVAGGLHAAPWADERPGAHVVRAARFAVWTQAEAGHGCPISMTYSIVPALRADPALSAEWEPRLTSRTYDPSDAPAATKSGALAGMAMTEKQGGSDVRANTTRAEPAGAPGEYRITGHKWFCSAPMSDAFLTLAQAERGLTCFLVPRVLPDGTRNPFAIQRLKDKLGNRSNASSEVEYRDTFARRVGEEGRGVRTILEMVHHTRLDCVTGSAGLMRRALAEAAHHAAHRSAFGRRLLEQPLMEAVLADLVLEVEAATALALRLARADDEAPGDPAARAFARIATAVAKYWVCKRAPAAIYEAMECLGGNGYVEESPLPRLYREAPVNAIWEGSGNVICLDVLRAMVREPESLPALQGELRLARGAHPAFDAFSAALERDLAQPAGAEVRARELVERMALALQASLLLRGAPSAVGEGFCAARLCARAGLLFGALPAEVAREPILRRVLAS
jgi:putative acyl-CoA dehydrogenase